MSRTVDIPLAALDGRRAGELLLMPCDCTRATHRWRIGPCHRCLDGWVSTGSTWVHCPHCWVTCVEGSYLSDDNQWRPCPLCKPHSMGEHILRAKRDQRPGPKAATTEPRVNGTGAGDSQDTDSHEPPADRTLWGDDEFRRKVVVFQQAAREIILAVEAARPDRAPTHPTSTPDEWCRPHLALGICEPRHRRTRPDGETEETPYCRWCYDFHRAHRIDPPETILRARHDGQRITHAMIDAALPKKRKRKKAGRR